MIKYFTLLGIIIALFSSCKDDQGKWTAVAFDNDTAIHVSKEIIYARLVKKFETPFDLNVENQTYSNVYVCVPANKIGADTIVLINPNVSEILDQTNCKRCTAVEIAPIQIGKITELSLPTEFIKSEFNNRYPFFGGSIKWEDKK